MVSAYSGRDWGKNVCLYVCRNINFEGYLCRALLIFTSYYYFYILLKTLSAYILVQISVMIIIKHYLGE